MNRVKVDAYVVAGVTDHITPWKGVYQTAKIYGDDATFVLSNSGHLQSLLNPPTNAKASFVAGLAEAPDGEAFLAGAEKRSGSCGCIGAIGSTSAPVRQPRHPPNWPGPRRSSRNFSLNEASNRRGRGHR